MQSHHEHPLSDLPKLDVSVAGLPVTSQVERLLQVLDERQRTIVILRFGLHDGITQTHSDIGQRIGLTASSIVKLVPKCMTTLYAHRPIVEPVVSMLEHSVEQHGGVMSRSALVDVLRGADHNDFDAPALLDLLLKLSDRLKPINDLSVVVIGTEPYAVEASTILRVFRLLGRALAAAKRPVPFEAIVPRFRQYEDAPGVSDRFILACAKAHPKIVVTPDQHYALRRWGERRIDRLIATLQDEGQPLHFNEITRRINHELPPDQHTTPSNVEHYIARFPHIFVRVGSGIFGLAEWNLINERVVADTIFRILSEAGTPLSVATVKAEVLRSWHVSSSAVRKALRVDTRFRRVHPGVYELSERPPEKGPRHT
jgi:hypothetical protein